MIYRILSWILLVFSSIACRKEVPVQPKEDPFAKLSIHEGSPSLKKLDAELNRTYQILLRTLPANDREEMVDEEKKWISRKEFRCLFSGQRPPITWAEKDACLIDETTSRIHFLAEIYPRTRDAQIEGQYLSFEEPGSLTVIAEPEGYSFSLEVTAPNDHTGHAEGFFEGGQREFTWTSAHEVCQQYGECCTLTFRIQDDAIQVYEEKCEIFHGANMFISGNFKKAKRKTPATSHNSR